MTFDRAILFLISPRIHILFSVLRVYILILYAVYAILADAQPSNVLAIHRNTENVFDSKRAGNVTKSNSITIIGRHHQNPYSGHIPVNRYMLVSLSTSFSASIRHDSSIRLAHPYCCLRNLTNLPFASVLLVAGSPASSYIAGASIQAHT